MKNEPEKKSGTPLMIIGAVLVLAAFLGWWFYSSSKTTSNTNVNKSPTPMRTPGIPANAPIGANPPNLSGSPTALVTLEEFADFQCGSCAAAHPTMNEIKALYGSRIRFIFRNFPLSIPAHDKAYDAAVAAEAAGMQGKFWDLQNMLFTNQQAWTANPNFRQIWKDYAQKIGLDVAKWENDIAGIAAKSRVDADMQRGKAIGVNSTPTLFINGNSVQFAEMNVQALKPLIDAELQKAAPQNQPAKTSNAPAANTSNSNK